MENRRDFLKKMSLITGALGASSVVPPAIQKALAINPNPGSTFMDAEHVVFLMQENRSFDHCFGTLKGVRGFNDPRVLRFENNRPIWFQQSQEGKCFAPFRLNIKDTKATWMSSLPHAWGNQVDAHQGGKMGGWLDAKKSGNKTYENMPLTMGYYDREDIPFYFALADAFTICDQYFCSSLTGTSPNRSYFWTGTIRERNETSAQAHLWNDEIDESEEITWKTYPERLQENGIDWKIYQNELSVPVGFDELEENLLANFGDNTIEYFKAYNVRLHQAHIDFLKKAVIRLQAEVKSQTAGKEWEENKAKLQKIESELQKIGSRTFESLTEHEKELHKRAFVTNINDPYYHQLEAFEYEENGEKRTLKIPKGDILHQFRADVTQGKLPTVSWLVAPCMFSDHPGAPWFGAWYLSEVMNILTQNPEVWKKTIFILNYDENDGYFDHVPPFVPPHPNHPESGKVSKGITDWESEFVTMEQKQGLDKWPETVKRSSPIGLGFRVPMIVASPWSRGGYVNSQVFDHTSCIQFLESFLAQKFGKNIIETQINPWRRAMCGDLTSIFRAYNGERFEALPFEKREPFVEKIFNAKFKKEPQNFVEVPKINKNWTLADEKKILPKQESGHKPSNALPYELYADIIHTEQKLQLIFAAGHTFFTDKAAGAGFLVYSDTPFKHQNGKVELHKNWTFSVKAGEQLVYEIDIRQFEENLIQLHVYSANGFYRALKINKNQIPDFDLRCTYEQSSFLKPTGQISLDFKTKNLPKSFELHIVDQLTGSTTKVDKLKRNQHTDIVLQGSDTHTWYDWVLKSPQYPAWEMRYAGRVETGKEGITDPLMGKID